MKLSIYVCPITFCYHDKYICCISYASDYIAQRTNVIDLYFMKNITPHCDVIIFKNDVHVFLFLFYR